MLVQWFKKLKKAKKNRQMSFSSGTVILDGLMLKSIKKKKGSQGLVWQGHSAERWVKGSTKASGWSLG